MKHLHDIKREVTPTSYPQKIVFTGTFFNARDSTAFANISNQYVFRYAIALDRPSAYWPLNDMLHNNV